jgi:HemY protein
MRVWWRWGLILVLLLGVGVAGTWIATHAGSVQFDIIGYRIVMPLWVLALSVGLMVLGCSTVIWSWMRVRLWRAKRRDVRHVHHQQQGLTYMTQLISALSSGDTAGAHKALQHCRRTLGAEHPLVQLCGLHVAAKQGEEGLVRSHLIALQAHPDTQFLAHTALMKEALEQGDKISALRYAKEAYSAQQHHKRTVMDYVALLLMAQEWGAAGEVIKAQKGRRSAFSASEMQQLEAMLHVMQYQHSDENAHIGRAFAVAPHFPPTYGAISQLIQHNEPQKAWRAVQRAWKLSPHPELTEIFLRHFYTLPKAKWLKYATELREMHPNMIESHLMMGQVAMHLQDYPLAHNHLKAALAISPQQRVYHLLARLEEEGYHDEKAAKGWLQKLSHAHPDPAWKCSACGQPHPHWQLECEGCHRFMTIEFGEKMHHENHATRIESLSV